MRSLGISKRISGIDLVVVLLRTLAGFEGLSSPRQERLRPKSTEEPPCPLQARCARQQ